MNNIITVPVVKCPYCAQLVNTLNIPQLPLGALVNTQYGAGFIVARSLIPNTNPDYRIQLINPRPGELVWNASGESDWLSIELVDPCPIDRLETPIRLKTWLLTKYHSSENKVLVSA